MIYYFRFATPRINHDSKHPTFKVDFTKYVGYLIIPNNPMHHPKIIYSWDCDIGAYV